MAVNPDRPTARVVSADEEREYRAARLDADIGSCDNCGSEDGERQAWRTPVVIDGQQEIVTTWLCEACRA